MEHIMTPLSEIAGHWSGLCRKPSTVPAIPSVADIRTGPVWEGQPDGRAGGPGVIRRGAGSAASGLRTLVHNPQLFWFPVIVALGFAGLSILKGALTGISASLEWQFFTDSALGWGRFATDPVITLLWPHFYPDTARLLWLLVQTFAVEIVAVLALIFLLAGLFETLGFHNSGRVSILHGCAMAGRSWRPLARWSGVAALAGTLLFIICRYSNLLNLDFTQILFTLLSQSPFNYVFTPNLVNFLPPGDPVFAGAGYFDAGLIDTLVLAGINGIIFLVTIFVIPLILFEEEDVKGAVVRSFILMKRAGGEVTACMLCLGIAVLGALLISLLFPAIAGGNIAVGTWPPPPGWLAAGLLYVLALSAVVSIAATVGGIAAMELYAGVAGARRAEA